MNGGKSELFMQVRGSKFVKYQECKIQESPDEVSVRLCVGCGVVVVVVVVVGMWWVFVCGGLREQGAVQGG